eukprot:TRINITY_DN105937_c0_g1_i1.p1 TRINITY_DN105937_c0_g1~~TRINITY_DN105937_c0_g1_i1.p1  ORF type:complete len:813 (-),score=95.06 TRINITY_DN105937_c0_g1_i1:59-2476(-)
MALRLLVVASDLRSQLLLPRIPLLLLASLPTLCRSQDVWTTSPPPGEIVPEILDRFTQVFQDKAFTSEWEACYADSAGLCAIDDLGLNIIKASEKITREIALCPHGCTFPVSMCKTWWRSVEDDVLTLRDKCAAENNWPSQCLTFQRSLRQKLANQSWEIPVLCSIVDPGPSYVRTPSCAALVKTTIANRMTLHDWGCGNQMSNRPAGAPHNKTTCIQNLCEVYKQFVWRMRPRNLHEDFEATTYDPNFLLPGCERLKSYNFDEDTCLNRKDIAGFCECLCPLQVDPLAGAQCDDVIDGYFLFGRFGAENVSITRECEGELCSFTGKRRGRFQCQSMEMNMPSTQECTAMQLPYIDMMQNMTTCPWLKHTGLAQHLECLDGSRCNFQTEGWDCCERHRGRGKCPPEYPVMCDTLCSGITEYCCREEGKCTPRTCPMLLSKELFYEYATTTTTIDLMAGADKDAKPDAAIVIELPFWWWVTLLTLVPCILLGLALYAVYRLWGDLFRTLPEHYPERVSLENDKYGAFTTVKAENRADNIDPTMPRITISMPDLPQNRPLGLELVELRVVRVHPWGKRNGWMVGDIIVDIAGHPVHTFEELWARIQVERNRPPVRFTVERWNILPSREELAAADELTKSKVEIGSATKEIQELDHQHHESFPRAMGANGLPGNIHGWDYEYEDDEDDLYDEYATDDFQFATKKKESFNHATGNGYINGKYVSRFSEQFQVIEKNDKAEAEDDDEKEAKEKDKKKKKAPPEPKKKPPVNAFIGDTERKGRSFAADAVVFSRDAWGRSQVKHLKAGQTS